MNLWRQPRNSMRGTQPASTDPRPHRRSARRPERYQIGGEFFGFYHHLLLTEDPHGANAGLAIRDTQDKLAQPRGRLTEYFFRVCQRHASNKKYLSVARFRGHVILRNEPKLLNATQRQHRLWSNKTR